MKIMTVKPRHGYSVVNPQTYKALPENGGPVDVDDYFWARALRDGDVVKVTPPAPAPAPAPAPLVATPVVAEKPKVVEAKSADKTVNTK